MSVKSYNWLLSREWDRREVRKNVQGIEAPRKVVILTWWKMHF